MLDALQLKTAGSIYRTALRRFWVAGHKGFTNSIS